MGRLFGLITITVLAVLTLAFNGQAVAEAYSPDLVEFNGRSALGFPPDARFSIARGGTLEFWVQADWRDDPGYDPVVLADFGKDQISLLISVMRDRSGVVLAAGSEEEVVLFDFSDNQLHHVAVIQLADGMVVYIDGQLAGTPELRALDIPSVGFWVGGVDGSENQFIGAVAALRIWATAVSQQAIADFAFADVFDGGSGGHPDLEHLTARSQFDENDIYLVSENVANR